MLFRSVTEVACALVLGILTNLLVNIRSGKKDKNEQITVEEISSENEKEETNE